MKINTKYFGEIEIGDEKIIHFDNGVILINTSGKKNHFFMASECRRTVPCISYS